MSGEFEALRGMVEYRYRGTSGPWVQLFRHVGVGPLVPLLRYAKQNGLLAKFPPKTAEWLLGLCEQQLGGRDKDGKQTAVLTPPSLLVATRLSSSIDALLQILPNHLAQHEHIYPEHDGGVTFQTPSAERALESLSLDPKVAIRYAYGIHPDAVDLTEPSNAFYRGVPNANAAVAVVDASSLFQLPNATIGLQGAAQVVRRSGRDEELLVMDRVEALFVLDLPGFDVSSPSRSLDDAASVLVSARVAQTH